MKSKHEVECELIRARDLANNYQNLRKEKAKGYVEALEWVLENE